MTAPTRRALRWSVPVDDQWHQIGSGQVLHVDARSNGTVEVWTLEGSAPSVGSGAQNAPQGSVSPLPGITGGPEGATGAPGGADEVGLADVAGR